MRGTNTPQEGQGPAKVVGLEARREFKKVEDWLLSGAALDLPLHEVEKKQERQMREVNRLLLQAHLRARGDGDIGPDVQIQTENGSETFERRKVRERHQTTVFGEVVVNRRPYSRPGHESVHPLDEELQLPSRSYSYEIQRRLTQEAVKGSFEEACATVEEFTGVEVPKRSAEKVLVEVAQDFDAFNEQREQPAPEDTGPILVAAVDCKGIPMKKAEGAEPTARRKKGQKANKKRMATVATVHTVQPRARTPQEVVESLFATEKREQPEERTRPEHKRVWGSLRKGKDRVIQEVRDEMERRDPAKDKKRIALTDGERALQQRVLKFLPGVLLILDLFHVLEYVWKAAHAFYREGSDEATQWAKNCVLRILEGRVDYVIRGMRQSATKQQIKGTRREAIDKAANYFQRNRSFMRYDEYLAQGWPIASGSVEGACKTLIRDRMERSGMRWTEEGAEAMVKVRAIYLTGNLDEYWEFHIAEEQKRIRSARGRPIHREAKAA